jgi:hypothetical protein
MSAARPLTKDSSDSILPTSPLGRLFVVRFRTEAAGVLVVDSTRRPSSMIEIS